MFIKVQKKKKKQKIEKKSQGNGNKLENSKIREGKGFFPFSPQRNSFTKNQSTPDEGTDDPEPIADKADKRSPFVDSKNEPIRCIDQPTNLRSRPHCTVVVCEAHLCKKKIFSLHENVDIEKEKNKKTFPMRKQTQRDDLKHAEA